MLLFFILLLFELCLEFDTQRILCEQSNTTVVDNILFYYQRIEVANGVVDCVERCIENAQFCKAALFLEHFDRMKKQQHNYCQFYSSNSESGGKAVGSKAIDTKDQIKSTLFEISHDCHAHTNGHLSEVMGKISPSAQRALRLITSQPNSTGQTIRFLNSETDFMVKERRSRINKIKEEKQTKIEEQPKLHREESSLPIGATTHTAEKQARQAEKYEVPNSSSPFQNEMPDESFASSNPKTPPNTLLGYPDSHYSGIYGRGSESSSRPIHPTVVSRGGSLPSDQLSSYIPGPTMYSHSMSNYPQSAAASYARPCSARPGTNDPCAPSGWTEWSTSAQCSVTCGNGVRQRRRYCLGHRQEKCKGESTKEEICELDECPKWEAWSTWSQCSVTCGMGVEHRERECIPTGGCSQGFGKEERSCERKPCPQWAHWQQWSDCSRTCGGGEKVRKRECLHGLGDDCPGSAQEYLVCSPQECPTWTDWSSWSHCSVTCGDEGTRLRQRECRYKGVVSTECQGPAQDQSACQLEPCAHWSKWSKWADCSTTCGHGQQLRTRECEPRGYGCAGGDREIKFCQLAVCPYFDQWSEWSGCSVTCGIGTCERKRKCYKNDPLPGAVLPSEEELNSLTDEPDFPQPSEDHRELEQGPINATSQLAKHAKSLGLDILQKASHETRPRLEEHTLEVVQSASSMLERRRAPLSKKSGTSFEESSGGCIGPEMERKMCNAGPCCDWTKWGAWGSCQMRCGSGSRIRERSCTIQPMPLYSDEYPSQNTPFSNILPSNLHPSYSYHQQNPVSVYTGSALKAGCDCPGKAKEEEACAAATSNINENCGRSGFSRPQFDEPLTVVMRNEQPDTQCKWDHWSEWKECSGSCSRATRTRDRHCIGSPTTCICEGDEVETELCSPKECLQRKDGSVSLPAHEAHSARLLGDAK